MLPIAGGTLLDNTIENLRAAGCSEIMIVVGYQAEKIKAPGVLYRMNDEYADNNILHSLMKASDFLVGPVIVSYSDIWVEPRIYQCLVETAGELVLAVDGDWQPYYEGRTEHPLSQAEKVYFDQVGVARNLGKHLVAEVSGQYTCGEFIGLWRMGSKGTARFCAEFARLDGQLGPDSKFQHATSWVKAYITDMMQELIDRGETVNCATFERGWAELDTVQDYERLPGIAARQGLATLSNADVTS